MRQKLVFLTALMAVLLSGIATAADSIQWATDLDDARTKAVQQNKLLLIHFSTPECPPCKLVESNVFPTQGVAQTINQYYVPLKVNANEEAALVVHFGVQAWPTDVIATVSGDAVHSMVTEQNPNRYVQKLAAVAMQNRSLVPSKNKDAVQIAQSPRQNESANQFAPNSVHQFAPSQPAPGQQWSTGIRPPDLSQSSAIAKRPGVDLGSRPGSPPLRGRMRTTRFGNVPAVTTDRYGGVGVGGNAVAAATPATVNNRFATGSQPAGQNIQQYAANQSAPTQAEIGNPYAANQLAANEQPTTATVAPPVSSRQPNSVAANNNRFGNTPGPATNAPAQSVTPSFSAPANQVAQVPTQQDLAAPNQVASNPVASVDAPEIGLDGRCPVTLITQSKWRKGDARWGAIHRGHTYLFAGEEEQQKFLSNPDEFSPMLAGMDVVELANAGRVVQGNRRYGVLYDDDGTGPRPSRIYLFDSVGTRNRFEAAPDEFLQPVMQAMQNGRLDSLLR